MVMLFKNIGIFTMIFNKKLIILYVLCIAVNVHIKTSSASHNQTIEQSIEKNKTKILQLVQENNRLVTDCQNLFDTITQETEQANQLSVSLLNINQSCDALEQFLEQITSFLKRLLEYKKTDVFNDEKNNVFQQEYERIDHLYNTLQTSFPSINSFIKNDIKTYNNLLISIRKNLQALEENTPLKKSLYLQFFNTTKQLDSAIEQYQKLLPEKGNISDNAWLSTHTKSIIENNKELKNKYGSSIDKLKNNLELLESYKKPEDSFVSKIDQCQKFYDEIKYELNAIDENKQKKQNQSSELTIQPEQEKNSLEDRIINNIQHNKKNHTSQNVKLEQKTIPVLKSKNNHTAEKKEKARLKALQKQEERIKKQEEKKQKKAQLALLKKEKQQKHNKTIFQLNPETEQEPKTTIIPSPINTTKSEPQTKFSTITIAKITEEQNLISKELELLQQNEEQENLLMISHNEKHIALEADLENLQKQVDLFITMATHLKINDTQPILKQMLTQESDLINLIKHLNFEQHSTLIKQQFIKEQNNIKLEQLLQESLKLCDAELQQLQTQNKAHEQEKVVQTYEKSQEEYKQKIKEVKEENIIKTEKFSHLQKNLQSKIQEFEQCQKKQTEILQTALLSQKQIDTLTPIDKQLSQFYSKFISSQKALTATNHQLLHKKNSSKKDLSHPSKIDQNINLKERALEKKQPQQELIIPEKTKNELIESIEKKRNITVYQLQELQYHEEKDNLLRASLQEQEAYAQEQIDNLEKEINQYKETLQDTTLNQDVKDSLDQLCNNQKNHIATIEKTNEEIEQLIIAHQNFKEHHTLDQEEFLKKIYQTYNVALETLKTVAPESDSQNTAQEEHFEIVVQDLEEAYNQITNRYKKDCILQKNKILEKQKFIQEELQLLKNLESTIEKTIYADEYSLQDLNHLQSLQKKLAQLLEQCIRAQQAIEQKTDLFL